MYPATHIYGEPTSMHVSNHKNLLAVGDDHGDIRVYSYPCPIPKPNAPGKNKNRNAVYSSFNPRIVLPLKYIPRAHIGSISQIRFTSDDK